MVDPYTASMQTQPLGNVPQALETRPPAVAAAGAAGAAPRPPNQMARPVTAPYLNGQMPPGGSRPPGPPGPPFKDERDPLLDDLESAGYSKETDEDDATVLDAGGHEVSPLPGHLEHYCTNVMWIFFLPLALGFLYFPIQAAMEEGDVSKFFRGFDYYGRMCGRDVCETGPCGRFIYFCARNAEEFPDTAHPICVDSCPTSNLTSHICWDADAMAAVSMPDVPTVEFNMKCLQREHAIKEKEDAKESRLFQGLSRFRGAGSIEGFLMDSLHSLARAKLIVLSTFGVALATSFFYMLFLRYLSGFLIHVSLLLMMIVPACFGLFHLFKVFTSGGLSEVIGGNTEVQTSFLSGIAGMCVALVLCCTLAHISRGIQTAEGCILATTDCMFEIPSILLEPLVSLVLKTLTVGPMVGLMLVYASTGRMVLLMSDSEVHRNLSLNGEQWAILAYMVFLTFWLVEITHNGTQYVLAYVSQRWYFTPYVDDVKVDVPHACLVFEGTGNMLRYHFGSVIMGAFLKTTFRIPKVIGFTLYLVGCCDHRRKGRDPEEQVNQCSFRLLMKLLRKEGYMDMAVTSHEYCQATAYAMGTLEDSSAELVLNWTQLIFQIGGWALTTGMCLLYATVMVSTPQYEDPAGDLFLNEPDSVVTVCALLGLSASISFMNVFDVVGDTILYCFALEEQRHKQQMKGKYDPYEEQSIFQKCTCRSKNGDSFLAWMLGYDDEKSEDVHHRAEQRAQYAPKSLLNALESAK